MAARSADMMMCGGSYDMQKGGHGWAESKDKKKLEGCEGDM